MALRPSSADLSKLDTLSGGGRRRLAGTSAHDFGRRGGAVPRGLLRLGPESLSLRRDCPTSSAVAPLHRLRSATAEACTTRSSSSAPTAPCSAREKSSSPLTSAAAARGGRAGDGAEAARARVGRRRPPRRPHLRRAQPALAHYALQAQQELRCTWRRPPTRSDGGAARSRTGWTPARHYAAEGQRFVLKSRRASSTTTRGSVAVYDTPELRRRAKRRARALGGVSSIIGPHGEIAGPLRCRRAC